MGGYGNFGARICRALATSPGIELIVAGRDESQASRLASSLNKNVAAARIDASDANLPAALRCLGAELVIHTAGPFQAQGYQVPRAVAEADAHYIDLADGRRFVCDFPLALDATFRARQRLAITGASTVPALSSAVINHLTSQWRHIQHIDFCIAPAQTAPRGIATLAAVLSYCGAPVQVWQKGAWTTQYGWANPQRVEFARLPPRLGALCDIPDLELFPAHYAGAESIMFRAALEVKIAQHAFALIAALRRRGMMGRPEQWARLLHVAAKRLDRFGSSLGGMVVRVTGTDAHGTTKHRAWHIAADHDHGPEIPCMPAILLARRLANGNISATGAHTSMGWLALSDFEPEFAQWGMVTDMRDETLRDGSVPHGT